MDGTSFAVHASTTPRRAERHTVQYFEMYGSRAIYKDGWWACAKLDKLPVGLLAGDARAVRARAAAGTPTQDAWELYYLPDDFSPGARPRGGATPRRSRS